VDSGGWRRRGGRSVMFWREEITFLDEIAMASLSPPFIASLLVKSTKIRNDK
jgi:hypothetical protein